MKYFSRKVGHIQDHVFVKVEIRPELNVFSRKNHV